MTLYNKISEIPLHNWEQLNITGDYHWLIKSGDGEPNPIELEEAYLDLHDQSAPLTGASEMYEKWQVLVIQRMEARLRYAEGDLSAQNWIEYYTMAIEQMMKGATDSDILKSRLIVQQAWGQPINAKETSYLEFLKIRQVVQEQYEQSKAARHGEN